MESSNPFGTGPPASGAPASRLAGATVSAGGAGAPSAGGGMSALLAARQNALSAKPVGPATGHAGGNGSGHFGAGGGGGGDLRVTAPHGHAASGGGGGGGSGAAAAGGASPSSFLNPFGSSSTPPPSFTSGSSSSASSSAAGASSGGHAHAHALQHAASSPHLAGGGAAASVNPLAWTGAGILLQPHWALDVTSEESAGTPNLRGEVPVFRDVECYLRGPGGVRVPGLLTATTYQLRFLPGGALPAIMRHLPMSAFAIPVSSIRKVERPQARSGGVGGMASSVGVGGVGGSAGGPSALLDVTAKDVRVLSLGFRDEPTADKMATHLKLIAFPPKIELVHAFSEGSTKGTPMAGTGQHHPGWDVYDARAELERQGVLGVRHPRSGEPLYRISDINATYAYAPTYPCVLAVPFRASDPMLQAVASFRSKARIPALTWMHPGSKTTMWRCSQPRVGMGGNTNAQDESLLSMIRESNVHSRNPHQPLLVADCRPRANAMANKAGGWGYEVYAGTALEFLNMHNIHAVRDAHRAVESLAMSMSPSDTTWAAAVAETQWPYHLRTVLSAGLFVAEALHRKGQNVLVHCSDGWDRTAQVCGLAQIFLDPYFRTVRGFGVMVAKDWASFGHKFGERAGHREEKDGGDISPVFVQFLDAVWQLVRLFPQAFEFDGRLLLYLAHHAHACRFGDFLANNERERTEMSLPSRTPSLWGTVLARPEAFRSPHYAGADAGDVLLPHPSAVLRNVVLWSDWFLRWSPFPSSPHECRLEKYADTVYDRSPVVAALMPYTASSAAAAAAAASSSSSSHGAGVGGVGGGGGAAIARSSSNLSASSSYAGGGGASPGGALSPSAASAEGSSTPSASPLAEGGADGASPGAGGEVSPAAGAAAAAGGGAEGGAEGGAHGHGHVHHDGHGHHDEAEAAEAATYSGFLARDEGDAVVAVEDDQ